MRKFAQFPISVKAGGNINRFFGRLGARYGRRWRRHRRSESGGQVSRGKGTFENPFPRGSRFAYAWDLLPNRVQSLLDYGCSEGCFLAALEGRVRVRYGVDRNAERIKRARRAVPSGLFEAIEDLKTTCEGGSFDAVTCLEVMEHVGCEKALVRELARVLKPNGVLILSTPHLGTLTLLDPGNFKFRFPWLVKFYYHALLRDPNTYQRRFIDAENGMIGDVSVQVGAMEHKHYTLARMTALLEPQFKIERVVTYGLLTPVIDILKGFFCLILRLKRFRPFFEALDHFDKRFSYGAASYNILIRCVRRASE